METETDTTWDLTHLIDLEAAGLDGGAGDAGPEAAVAALLEQADRRAEAFAGRYEGVVGDLDGPGLVEAMTALAEISDLVGRALNYAHLSFAADTADPKVGALLQSASERATRINTRLLFFELEWVAIEDDRAEALLETEGLEFSAPGAGCSTSSPPRSPSRCPVPTLPRPSTRRCRTSSTPTARSAGQRPRR
jgi:oligoendopeptidase F